MTLPPGITDYLLSNIRTEMNDIATRARGASSVLNPSRDVLAEPGHPLAQRYAVLLAAANELGSTMQIKTQLLMPGSTWRFDVTE